MQFNAGGSEIRILLFAVLSVLLAGPIAAQEFADTQCVPSGPKSAARVGGAGYDDVVSTAFGGANPVIFDRFAGQNAELRAQALEQKSLQIAEGFPTSLLSEDMLALASSDGETALYAAEIASTGATALRLVVDLSTLADGEELFVVDLTGPAVFGPYTRNDAVDGGNWLPTTTGESATLVVRTRYDAVPQFELLGVSHFYLSFAELKELDCNNDVSCDSDPAIQELSRAVGLLVVPQNGFDSAVCSGTAITNPNTSEFEPYFLTANHCVPTFASIDEVEVIWDFRTGFCNSGAPPSLASLPRSSVASLLATSGLFDLTLLELGVIPAGAGGRCYAGWDTRAPAVDEPMAGIHHPDGAFMRISYGHVEAINEARPMLGYQNQTRVFWDDGVTEGGSSGSGIFFDDGSLRLFGALSNGFTHNCVFTSNNKDWYSSFRHFFPSVEGFLMDSGNPTDQLLTITRNAPEGGFVTTDPPGTLFPNNTPVELTVHAVPGWEFTGWSGAVVSQDLSVFVVMDGDQNVIASFSFTGNDKPQGCYADAAGIEVSMTDRLADFVVVFVVFSLLAARSRFKTRRLLPPGGLWAGLRGR